MRLTAILDWLLHRVMLPLVGISAALLHLYTAYAAFNLATTKLWGYVAAAAAWATPAVSQLVVAYYAWRNSGSMINGYSFWVLAWLGLLTVTTLLMWAYRRLSPPQTAALQSPQTPIHFS